jgi:hypothetical protein
MAEFEDALAKEIADVFREHVAAVTGPCAIGLKGSSSAPFRRKNRLRNSAIVACGNPASSIGETIS